MSPFHTSRHLTAELAGGLEVETFAPPDVDFRKASATSMMAVFMTLISTSKRCATSEGPLAPPVARDVDAVHLRPFGVRSLRGERRPPVSALPATALFENVERPRVRFSRPGITSEVFTLRTLSPAVISSVRKVWRSRKGSGATHSG